jgi:hypothetical protein
VAVVTAPRTQTPPLRVLNGDAWLTSGAETREVISPELALVDPKLAARARSGLRSYASDELVAEVQPTPHANEIGPESSGDEKRVLSPELALVDPVLADWARAQLAVGEPDSPAAPVRRPAQSPQTPCPSNVTARADQAEPVARRRRARSKRNVIVAVALAAGLAATAAIWALYDDGGSASRATQLAPFQPQLELSPAAIRERSEATTPKASERGIAGGRHGSRATRSGRLGTGGSIRRSGIRTQTPRRSRPAAFHVPGAPKEPLDEIPLPARAQRLGAWLSRGRDPTAANERHWLYQHAWIVTGARFGWWHGATALRVLIRVDRRIEYKWGIGYRSEALARTALAAVEASAK